MRRSDTADKSETARLRAVSADRITYDLTAVGTDVADVVGAAGGWICDRVRAGWRVNVLVPAGSDWRAIQILGAGALNFDTHIESLAIPPPAAIAVSARLFADSEPVRATVTSVVQQDAELTFWGDCESLDFARRLEPVCYRMSACARALKHQALLAAEVDWDPAEAVESFRSCGLWYPPGPDLSPVGWRAP